MSAPFMETIDQYPKNDAAILCRGTFVENAELLSTLRTNFRAVRPFIVSLNKQANKKNQSILAGVQFDVVYKTQSGKVEQDVTKRVYTLFNQTSKDNIDSIAQKLLEVRGVSGYHHLELIAKFLLSKLVSEPQFQAMYLSLLNRLTSRADIWVIPTSATHSIGLRRIMMDLIQSLFETTFETATGDSDWQGSAITKEVSIVRLVGQLCRQGFILNPIPFIHKIVGCCLKFRRLSKEPLQLFHNDGLELMVALLSSFNNTELTVFYMSRLLGIERNKRESLSVRFAFLFEIELDKHPSGFEQKCVEQFIDAWKRLCSELYIDSESGVAMCDTNSRTMCDTNSRTMCDTNSRTMCDTNSRTMCDTNSRTACDTNSRTMCESDAQIAKSVSNDSLNSDASFVYKASETSAKKSGRTGGGRKRSTKSEPTRNSTQGSTQGSTHGPKQSSSPTNSPTPNSTTNSPTPNSTTNSPTPNSMDDEPKLSEYDDWDDHRASVKEVDYDTVESISFVITEFYEHLDYSELLCDLRHFISRPNIVTVVDDKLTYLVNGFVLSLCKLGSTQLQTTLGTIDVEKFWKTVVECATAESATRTETKSVVSPEPAIEHQTILSVIDSVRHQSWTVDFPKLSKVLDSIDPMWRS
jgi:hypothetical protein